MSDFAAARLHMVQNQLQPNKLTDDRVAAAMAEVPRERFVPETVAGVAYLDEDLEIAPGRYLMEPMVLARMLQAIEAGPGDLALDVGCGTGYSTVVLAKLVGTVVGLESDEELAARADDILADLSVDNAVVVVGELAAGRADQGPYNLILLGGSTPRIPEGLKDQLDEGGRLVGVVKRAGVGRATMITRRGDDFHDEELFDAMAPPLPGFEEDAGFVF
jgi:protein-L-isoaspartate(D-aspartate) O-methyltransferase